jgi:hypothetical protein
LIINRARTRPVSVPASGAREENQALLGEAVHECGVVGEVGLRRDPTVEEAGAGLADDGVEAHRARAITVWNVFWRR